MAQPQYRTLHVTLLSARDLKEVNLLGKMDVYALLSLADLPPAPPQRTPTHSGAGKNPSWKDHELRFAVPEPAPPGAALRILLRAERALGDKDIGEAFIPLEELLAAGSAGDGKKFVSYQVRSLGSGNAHGVVNISYKIGEPMAAAAGVAAPPPVNYAYAPAGYPSNDYYAPPPSAPPMMPVNSYAPPPLYPPPASSTPIYPPPAAAPSKPAKDTDFDKPVTAYPVGAAPASSSVPYSAYPPPPPAPAPAGYTYGYAPPPPYGYGYPPPPPSYGYGYPPPPPQQQSGGGNFGLGLGAGLLGGAVGGLLLGEVLEDIFD